MAASPSLSRRGGSGSRALPPVSPGRSAAKATSMSPLPAIARKQTPTARLNGSVGASLAVLLGLMLEVMVSAVIPGRHRSRVYPRSTLQSPSRQLPTWLAANQESIFTILAGQSHDRDYGSPLSRGRRYESATFTALSGNS